MSVTGEDKRAVRREFSDRCQGWSLDWKKRRRRVGAAARDKGRLFDLTDQLEDLHRMRAQLLRKLILNWRGGLHEA